MTDTKTLTRPADEPAEPKPRLLEMSATQLIGGALAAMTAAVIGARLGVAGTVLGAAIGSVVAGAASAVYTASLKHTRDKLTSAFVGRVGDTSVKLSTVRTATTPGDRLATGYGMAPGRAADGRAADDSATRVLSTRGWATGDWATEDRTSGDGASGDWAGRDGDGSPPAAAAPPSPDPVATAADVDAAGRPVSRRPWRAVLVSTAVVFLLAIAGLTTFELLSGQAVSGGQGTTLTQVGEGRSGGSDTPVQAPSAETSTSPTAEPSATPSTEPSAAPSAEPTTSTAPSTEPSQTPEPSTDTQPGASETPSAPTSADPQATPPGTTAGG